MQRTGKLTHPARRAAQVLILNPPGGVHNGDELIAVIDLVFHDRCLTGHFQCLVDAVPGIVIRVRRSETASRRHWHL